MIKKLNNFLKITGVLNNVFRPQKTLMKTRIKQYNTLALPVLLYGSETWTINPLNAELNPICPLLALFALTIFSTLAGKGLKQVTPEE